MRNKYSVRGWNDGEYTELIIIAVNKAMAIDIAMDDMSEVDIQNTHYIGKE